jgi:hypothetical protein
VKWGTAHNFAAGGAFFVLMVGLIAYQAFQETDCRNSGHTVLVLVDYTDHIGVDAHASLKDRVWTIAESAPAFSRVILRPILGADAQGRMLDKETVEYCRGESPKASDSLRGAVKIRQNWCEFKNLVCGRADGHPSSVCDGKRESADLRCGDELRQGSFFEKERPVSESSPILEQVVDNTRRFLTVPDKPVSWDLVIASDWKEYTQQLDLHTRSCEGAANGLIAKIPLFIPPNQQGKVFRAPDLNEAASGRGSSITSLFVLRDGMSDTEADCLEEFAKQFLVTNASNIPPSGIVFDRLPRTAGNQ